MFKITHNDESPNYESSLRNVVYIIYIIQNRTNLVMHIINSQGKPVFSMNSFAVGFSGKAKQKAQATIVKKFVQVLITSSKLSFLKNKSTALHLKNIGFIKQWLIKKLKFSFYLESVKTFTTVPFNGCRQKKLRRKKVKKS